LGRVARPALVGRPFGDHLGPKADHGLTAGSARPRGERPVDPDAHREERGRPATTAPATDPLDPMTRALSALGVQRSAVAPVATAPPDDSVVRASRVSLEHVLGRLVRRIAWSGDSHSGSARLELGAGALEGATLTIHADDGRVRVSLEVPPGVDATAWKDRILRRLGARGLQLAELEVG
jgi:hypothetical protein